MTKTQNVPRGFEQPTDSIYDLLLAILEQIVLHPEEIEITTSCGDSETTTYRFRVHAGDMKRVIGKQGRNFGGIRRLIETAGIVNGKLVKLGDVLEPTNGTIDNYPARRKCSTWNSSSAVELASKICDSIFNCPCRISVFNYEEHGPVDGMDMDEPFDSVIEIALSGQENERKINLVASSMSPIFERIGLLAGRNLDVKITN